MPRPTNSCNLGNNEYNTYVWDNTLTWMRTAKHNLVAMVDIQLENINPKCFFQVKWKRTPDEKH